MLPPFFFFQCGDYREYGESLLLSKSFTFFTPITLQSILTRADIDTAGCFWLFLVAIYSFQYHCFLFNAVQLSK